MTIHSRRNIATISSMGTTRTSSPSDLMTRLSQRGSSFRDMCSFRFSYFIAYQVAPQYRETHDESMTIRLEGVPQRYHEDHIAAKGINSLSLYNLVHKFIPMPQGLKIPDAKAAVEKNGKF